MSKPSIHHQRQRAGDFIQRERTASYEHIDGLRDTAALLWRKACEVENIPVDALFVTFSPGNRFAELYNNVIQELLEKIEAAARLGYAGLRINRKGRAELL